MIQIRILKESINISGCIDAVMSSSSGGIDVFIGTVRDTTKGMRVLRLEFEAYERMAISELQKIADRACSQWPVHQLVVHHRTGLLLPGETAVVIAVSASHRAAAFEACRYVIDTLKQTVPIWKKEVFENGEVWVAAHP